MEREKTLWTIGHSTRAEVEFLNLLHSFQIKQLIDVRRFPSSRKFPHFNKENLEVVIPKNGVTYIHLESLGGRRKANPDSKNTVWNHPSFRGYADYMETENFRKAFDNLQKLALKKSSAIMCSEAVWWRCHRSMIADKLKVADWQVLHILGENQLQEHPYTKPAKIVSGQLNYH
ncbi:DUF488 family protein [Xanthomarina sp. F2636L]|uniref:DUF488 domain-containing protein n=1 Tax=Xanthomarina sp. F2636L TaxID=2996018 RepID=UPI00225E34FC|nr:DUF488 domain-containing protein [Xanthomarina sp. F2636L]MCX7551955.1 DUF488 domain-containing protein [Xanthomarina sp. F2636L]